jgi:hypothetical protein
MIRATVTAIAWHLGKSKQSIREAELTSTFESEAAFLLFQMKNMPDYLRLPFYMLTIFFGLHTVIFYGKPFFKLKPHQREKVILSWKNARLSFMPVYIKFHDSLVTLYVYSKH